MQREVSRERKTSIGGQALMEGLLMVGPERTAMAFLLPDKEIRLEWVKAPCRRSRIPFLRGIINLFSQLKTGMAALMRSAEIQEAAEAPETARPAADGRVRDTITKSLLFAFSIFLGLGLFILLPSLVTSAILALGAPPRQSYGLSFAYNLLEALIRMSILVLYMWITSKQKDIFRVWQFHGAEHKTIACYEACQELTVENVRRFSRFHPRCGTSFLIVIVFISALVYSLVGWHDVWINLLFRLLMLPVIAGLAYELLRFSGAHSATWYGRILAAPGLWLQRLTTREPEDEMIRVAICAMEAVIPEEAGRDAW